VNTIQALLFAILQAITELFPVSSLGHAVVLPALLGWSVDQKAPDFLPFLVALHLGTAIALLLYFWPEWLGILLALLGGGTIDDRRAARRLLLCLVLATIPAAIIGLVFENFLQLLFGTPAVAAAFLMVNGILLFVGERFRQYAGDRSLGSLSCKAALAIGACQSLALIPGISRSGITILGGLLAGLRQADAARFSFLLATPIILGATLLEVPHLTHDETGTTGLGKLAILSGAVAGVAAYVSVTLLMRYFKQREFDALDPFAYYCWGVGGVASIPLAVF
jgi:undecaprenyl-diphosphatase